MSRIPLARLRLQDESDIPEMPADIFEKPNDKQIEMSIKEIDEKISHHFNSIVSLSINTIRES